MNRMPYKKLLEIIISGFKIRRRFHIDGLHNIAVQSGFDLLDDWAFLLSC
jgi:hypothetical protein